MALSNGQLTNFNLEALWSGLGESKTSDHMGIYDWVGDFYPYGSFPAMPPVGWQSPVTPDQAGDGFRAGPTEWLAFALALKLCLNGDSPPTIIEAGASQGLWCLPWIRCLNRIGRHVTDIRGIAFEASPSLDVTESFWRSQQLEIKRTSKSDDRLTLEGDRWTLEWNQHAISWYDGTAFFPNVSCQDHNGRSMSSTSLASLTPINLWRTVQAWRKRKSRPRLMSVKVENLATVLEEVGSVGLLHMDLQGEELPIMEQQAIDAIQGRVDVFMLGTHSREAESLACSYLPTLGFTNLLQSPAVFRWGFVLCRDGEQLWISTKALAAARHAGFITN